PAAGVWALGATACGLLASMAAMAAARTGGDPWVALISVEGHYAAYACFLPAVTAAGLHSLLRPGPSRAGALAAFWLACAAAGALTGSWDRARLSASAALFGTQRHQLVELLRAPPAARDRVDEAYHGMLESALRLDLPFARGLAESAARPPRARAARLDGPASLGPFMLFPSDAAPRRGAGRLIGHFVETAFLSFAPGEAWVSVASLGAAPHPAPAPPSLAVVPTMLGVFRLMLRVPAPLAGVLPVSRERRAALPSAAGRGERGSRLLIDDPVLRAGALLLEKPVAWDEGRGRLLLCYKGEAVVRAGTDELVSRPGTAVYLPRALAGPVTVTPGPEGYAGAWLDAVKSR
ncbi:MAG: hypothetical protein SF051_10030, partial [Elusimicrobiota bacterium]|nr:hypothetical protein [Elusimicrobiota bacterium]